ncbi:MAG: aminoacyl-histidine dipeptidase [Spirochaetia bacterium]|nr:aminoacyl-histidine dipeptidase [Spirochaetia bacterium]
MKQNSLFDSPVWNYFKQLSDIPRESGNESGVREFLLAFAKTHNLSSAVDKAGNVIIRKGATKGKENVPSLALQGHMDMVCVKGEGSNHNFLNDGITLIQEGDFLHGDNTTLGADNGIAIALILDLFTDESAVHGPLEAIFTTEEETGLTGAFNLDGSLIESKRMLNLDSEEEGVFLIGSAGGNEVDGVLSFERSEIVQTHPESYEIEINGLLGGHSGGEIHTQRGNAIVFMTRVLYELQKATPIQLISIKSGTKRNVIPSSCKALIAIDNKDKEKLEEIITSYKEILTNEFRHIEKNIILKAKKIELATTSALSVEETSSFFKGLMLAPNGVQRMSDNIKGIVETSANLAILNTTDSTITMVSSQRGEIESALRFVSEKTALAFSISGAKVRVGNSYPAWTPRPDSPLAEFCATAYKAIHKEEAVVTAIHAGLECGIINERVPGMDSVSLGPNIYDAHSIKERVSISSTERIAAFLRHLCEIIE